MDSSSGPGNRINSPSQESTTLFWLNRWTSLDAQLSSKEFLLLHFTLASMAVDIKAKNISKADRKLVDLMLFGLRHGIESIRIKGKGPIVPFLAMETNGEKEILKLFTEDPDAGLGEGIRLIKTDRKSQFVVIVYDGYLPQGEKMIHAIIAKGYDRNDTVGYAYAQRYSPQKFFSWFKLIGDRAYLGNTDQLLPK